MLAVISSAESVTHHQHVHNLYSVQARHEIWHYNSGSIVVVIAGVLGVGLFVFGLRTFCYSQLTYVTAAMLANSLPKTDLRIVQIGGGIKELYYYPSTTVQVCRPTAHQASELKCLAGNVHICGWL